MKRQSPDTSSDTELSSKRRTPSPATSSEASSISSFNSSGDLTNIDLQTEDIIAIASNHNGNPGKLTTLLLDSNYQLESIEKAFLFLETLKLIPEHNLKAILNAIQEIQEKNREQLIQAQADLIRKQIKFFRGKPSELYSQLLDSTDPRGKPYKADAFKLVLDNNSFPPATQESLTNAYLDRKIGYIKQRTLDPAGQKPDGQTIGGQVRKSRKPNDTNVKKHKNIWLQKTGALNPGLVEDVCEYIGTNLINHMLDENSPKLRLHQDSDGEITLLSKYIDNFETFRNEPTDKVRKLIHNSENFAIFFAANALIYDYDIHPGNVGIRISDRYYLARIDNGCALSYHIDRNFRQRSKVTTTTPGSAEDFKQTMLSLDIYSPEMFEGIEFATKLSQSINNINLREMREIIDISIYNLKKAYGEDFLNDPSIAQNLKKRLGIDPNTNLDKELLTNIIISNMTRIKEELNELALAQMSRFFPSHPKQALDECIKLKKENSGFIDYSQLLNNLQNRFPKFNPQQPRYLQSHGDTDLETAKIEAITNRLSRSPENIEELALESSNKLPQETKRKESVTTIPNTPNKKPQIHVGRLS